MKEIAGMWKEAYREASWHGRLLILYLVAGMPALVAGSLVYLARLAL